jgi:hypothetical protein
MKKSCKVNKNKVTPKKLKYNGKKDALTLRGVKGMKRQGYPYPIK